MQRPITPSSPLNNKGKEIWSGHEESNYRVKTQLEEANKKILMLQKMLSDTVKQTHPQAIPKPEMDPYLKGTMEKDCTTARVNLPFELIQEVEEDFASRCLVGLPFGPRPPIEFLRKWMEDTWQYLEIVVKIVEVLPKGYHIFCFQDKKMELNVLGARQWMY